MKKNISEEKTSIKNMLKYFKEKLAEIGCSSIENLWKVDEKKLFLEENETRLDMIIWLLNRRDRRISSLLVDINSLDSKSRIEQIAKICICCGICSEHNAIDVVRGTAESKYQIKFWENIIKNSFTTNNINFKSNCNSLDSAIFEYNINTTHAHTKDKIVDADQVIANCERTTLEYDKNIEILKSINIKPEDNPIEWYAQNKLNDFKDLISISKHELTSFLEFYDNNLKFVAESTQTHLNTWKPLIVDEKLINNAIEPVKFCKIVSEVTQCIENAQNKIDEKTSNVINLAETRIEIEEFCHMNELLYNNI
ncbi:hypothetical protein MXB_482 [Myxobolus squamalis]|nr:hypothetical protein MXB_482 [Myxobolus squamalis]